MSRDLRAYIGDLDLTDYPYSLAYNELDLGAGENVMTFFEALLQDGSIGTSTRTENRTLVVPIYVEGADLLELAQNEEALILACEKARNTFTLDPGDGIAPPSVYDTFRVQARHARNDDQETALLRRWDLVIPALPWARPVDPITVTFSPATPTITTLDDGSALTNWSLASGSAPAVLSVATRLGEQAVKVEQSTSDNVSPLVRVAVTPVTSYIAVDMSVDNYAGGAPEVGLVVAGADVNAVASQLQASGYRRYFFAAPADGVVVLRLKPWRSGFGYTTATSYVGGVYGATSIPATGVLSAEIPGSVRTQGVITVSGAAALGDTMVYCDPTMQTLGWQPDEDSTWPQAPEGSYMIYRKDAASGAGGTFTASAGGQTVSTYLAAGAVPNNSWFPVGRVALGGNRSGRLGTSYSPLTDANTRIFRMAPETSLTYVRGMTDTRLLIDLPSLEFPRGGVWAGADGSEVSVLDSTDAWEFPTLTPPVTAFFIRATGDANAVSTATFYPRSHTFNAYEAS